MGCSHSSTEKQGFHDKYRLGNKLANRGAYGETYVATPVQKGKKSPGEQQTKSDVKIIDLDRRDSKRSSLVENEVARWKAIGDHKNIVQLREVFYSDCKTDDYACRLCYIVMELSSSTLIQHLEKLPILNEVVLGKDFAQMLLGLQFLHEKSLVHRDINHDSFTVSGDKVKLGDFGRTVEMGSDSEGLQGICGTHAYMAPEMILGHGYNEKVDLWSVGTLIYALLFGSLPYNANDTKNFGEQSPRGSCTAKDVKISSEGIKKAISSGEEQPTFMPLVDLSCGAVAFAMAMLERDPSRRPFARSALDKAYMVSIIKCKRDGEVDLPSLSSSFMRAKQSRAFDVRDNSKGGGLEDLLNKMQLQKLGVPLPSKSPNLLEANPEDLARIDLMKGAKDNPLRSRASSSSDFRSDAPVKSAPVLDV